MTMLLDEVITIDLDDVVLEAHIAIPLVASGVVVFAHGSGSSRHSPRNQYVAGVLKQAGIGTVLVDLLTREEELVDLKTRSLRFDIGLLSDRLARIIDWLGDQPDTATYPIGLFGASTGSAAALIAATERPGPVRAVVSRGGRVDLAEGVLPRVRAATLLIVGERDRPVIEINRRALELLKVEKRLEIVPGASHLFEEPGALEQVAALARDWFARYLGSVSPHLA
jgi:pimeloyl-ACP methyl ester carboxylesterase